MRLYADTWEEEQLMSYSHVDIPTIIISDCDGILTDGNLGCTKDGKFMKTYGCHDKEMVNLMKRLGYQMLFVTNDKSGYEITKNRVESSFKLECMLASPSDRTDLIKDYISRGFRVVYCGDSPSDVAPVMAATYSCTTNNCFWPVKQYFNYVSTYNGGEGGFADILYHIMNLWNCD